MPNKVVCFGEMLLDCFPDKVIPGGAPMNVALHLKQLGLNVQMISKVGKDDNGELILNFVKSFDLPVDNVQQDPNYPTGTVIVDNKDKENIKYEIVAPVAWDFIAYTPQNEEAVHLADAFIFGSLSIRNDFSWETLKKLISHSPALKVFDINIRPPFYDFFKISWLLNHTDILKINEDELQLISDHYQLPSEPSAFCQKLIHTFPISMVCITLGAKGAMIYKEGTIETHPGFEVTVEDTVGSGDAFLSGLVKNYLENKSLSEILEFSCGLGAFVATKKGGTPNYQLEDVYTLISK
jgi:fructokinase